MTKIETNPYIRVGTSYFKKINHPLASGDSSTQLVKWNLNTIRQDENKEFIVSIPKYDTFCTIPDHLNFKKIIGSAYNQYEPLEHIPKEGNCEKTLSFYKHIFGDQFELGLDYVKILYENPMQPLPILCLVSSERNTGKTTFLNHLKSIFGANMTINTNEDFRNQFNSGWASKLIIGVDEVLLDKKEDSERIKNLSTSKYFKAEAKGVDKIEIEFFGKFILCSNNEENFIKIDSEEIRYWIRKVNSLRNDNINLLSELKNEIPAFLFFLQNKTCSTKRESRMWFTKEQIETEALRKVIKGNQSYLEREIREIITEQLLNFELEEICFTISDLVELTKGTTRVTKSQVSDIVRKRFLLTPIKTPSTYKGYKFLPDGFTDVRTEVETKKGRYYTFHKSFFVQESSLVDSQVKNQ